MGKDQNMSQHYLYFQVMIVLWHRLAGGMVLTHSPAAIYFLYCNVLLSEWPSAVNPDDVFSFHVSGADHNGLIFESKF